MSNLDCRMSIGEGNRKGLSFPISKNPILIGNLQTETGVERDDAYPPSLSGNGSGKNGQD
jgi:hypothetical protein